LRTKEIKIINQAQYPDAEIGAIIHNLESGTSSGMTALVADCGSLYRGLYRNIQFLTKSKGGMRWVNFLFRIGIPDKFPVTDVHYPGLSTAPDLTLVNWREAFVTLVAHELEHHNQYRRSIRKMAKYAATHTPLESRDYKYKHNWYSEVKAEKKALKVLNRWRDNPRLRELLYPQGLLPTNPNVYTGEK